MMISRLGARPRRAVNETFRSNIGGNVRQPRCDNDKMVMWIGQLKLLITFDTVVKMISLMYQIEADIMPFLPIYSDQKGTFWETRRH